MSAVPHSAPPILEIEPSRGWVSLKLDELWEYRELLYFLVWREVKVRYKQTAIGVLWALLQPVLSMVIFSLFFGRLANMPSDGVPYPLFCLTGLVPWTLFANGVSQSSNSLVSSANLIKKVYFPRLAMPIASVVAGVIDFAIGFVLLLAVAFYFGVTPTTRVLWLPAFLLLGIVSALGPGLWSSALHVRYRDVRFVIPFLIQIWMFATPIVYPSSLLQEPWRSVYGFNPMVGVVDGFRWSLLGVGHPPGNLFAASVGASLLILCSGAFYFRRMEKQFADIV